MRYSIAVIVLGVLSLAVSSASAGGYSPGAKHAHAHGHAHAHTQHRWCKEAPRAGIVESVAIRRLGVRPENVEERIERVREEERRRAEREREQERLRIDRESLETRLDKLEERFTRVIQILESQTRSLEKLDERVNTVELKGKSAVRLQREPPVSPTAHQR